MDKIIFGIIVGLFSTLTQASPFNYSVGLNFKQLETASQAIEVGINNKDWAQGNFGFSLGKQTYSSENADGLRYKSLSDYSVYYLAADPTDQLALRVRFELGYRTGFPIDGKSSGHSYFEQSIGFGNGGKGINLCGDIGIRLNFLSQRSKFMAGEHRIEPMTVFPRFGFNLNF